MYEGKPWSDRLNELAEFTDGWYYDGQLLAVNKSTLDSLDMLATTFVEPALRAKLTMSLFVSVEYAEGGAEMEFTTVDGIHQINIGISNTGTNFFAYQIFIDFSGLPTDIHDSELDTDNIQKLIDFVLSVMSDIEKG